ncbi:hypothetical protein ACWCQN_39925 [Streptomyces sp. NPDC001984]|uniref:hypothetical protein n=1 Tax=Streptomyces sp. NPDC002619 TaxID=3364655 RepID=UPI0036809B3D
MTAPDPLTGPPGAAGDDDGVRVPAALAYPLWPALRAEVQRARRNGHDIRPEVVRALEALRAAAHDHMSASRPSNRTLPDDQASDRLVTTGELAGRLGVTGRHVLRLAAAEGVTRVAWGLWAAEDADRLVRTHRRAA